MSARIVVLDSVTQCQGRVQLGDVVVAGSFAGALSLGLALPFGIRALIAHAAGVGKDEAGISALPAAAGNARDVLCAGSHGGRVNVDALLRIVKPRGVIASDGGMAKDRSGASGLAMLDDAGVAGATVSAWSARIGDARSSWGDGVIS